MAKLRVTFEEFSARVDKAYNGRISIVESTYTGTRNKVTAYCNVHKIYFEVKRAYDLSVGKINCPECSKEHIQEQNDAKITSFSEILRKFRESYGNKFLYDESSYHGFKKTMKVHCNDCGEDFEITPAHHLKYNNGGCPNCHKYKIIKCQICGKDVKVNNHCKDDYQVICDDCKKIKKEVYEKRKQDKEIKCGRRIKPWSSVYKKFIEKYNGHFSYDESTYCGIEKPMKMHCNECGLDFEISPKRHLKNNNGGCPNCNHYVLKQCIYCGKDVLVGKHVLNVYCEECENHFNEERRKNRNLKLKEKYIKCPFCGQYHKSNEKCSNDLCNQFHSINCLQKLIPFGFDYSTIGTLDYIKEFNKAVNIILGEYYDNKLSAHSIFIKYNCQEYFKCEGTLRYFIKQKLKQKTRSLSEAQHNAIETGVSKIEIDPYHFKTEHHISWENKIFLLRSSYEIDFANILDEKKIVYEVESIRIRYFDTQERHERIAIPDFYLPETNTIVEIKSTWTLDPINMIDKVKAYKENGYNFKMILEHKEVDIYSLINEPRYKGKGRKHFSLKRKKVGLIGKWHWMNDGINNYKVLESQIDEYKSKGFVFGCLMNVRNNSNQDNLIIESLTQQPESSDTPSSNPLF